ncbi:GntR family transcriptional regulator [Metabacillus arenae]|uniref:GntR family transcriptional regulator n=1 Tax=Metabacillus arenae TaxID=2771434 RepID=A0A926S1Y4_9BACI|nr:GntR family transcriptional regulator [Metabacillus arenae]MBD1381439.1 GntR family transcriptional regulator [Metabacillus arenae]
MRSNIKSNSVSSREFVYQELRNQILSFQLEPGTSISEKEISTQFNVSRTPVREAFLRLAQEGLLNVYPQKGTSVSLIDLELQEEARFMREHLERAVIRLACDGMAKEKLQALEMNVRMQGFCIEEKNYLKLFELDEEFHRTIFEGCEKERTWQAIELMNVHLNRSRMLRLVTDYNWQEIVEHHKAILTAIKTNDHENAEDIMRRHLTLAVDDKDKLQKQYPHFYK